MPSCSGEECIGGASARLQLHNDGWAAFPNGRLPQWIVFEKVVTDTRHYIIDTIYMRSRIAARLGILIVVSVVVKHTRDCDICSAVRVLVDIVPVLSIVVE